MGNLPRKVRNYEAEERPTVKEFYRLNHRYQTLDFVTQKKKEYLTLDRRTMGVWEALEYLDTLVDDSDPDLNLTQIDHALQTAESARGAKQPRWFIVTGLIHDLGKILCLWGEPQWAVRRHVSGWVRVFRKIAIRSSSEHPATTSDTHRVGLTPPCGQAVHMFGARYYPTSGEERLPGALTLSGYSFYGVIGGQSTSLPLTIAICSGGSRFNRYDRIRKVIQPDAAAAQYYESGRDSSLNR